jgi:hypothetical protein
MMLEVVIPIINDMREGIVCLAAARAAGTPLGHAGPPATAAALAAERVVLLLDGEYITLTECLTIFLEEIDAHPELAGWVLLKLAAACSKTQQPCDVSPLFMALKALTKGRLGVTCEGGDMNQVHWLEEVLLARIPSASRATFVNFLRQAPSLVARALDARNIAQGWQDSGVCPLDIPKVLAQCPRFDGFSHRQSKALVAAVTPLTALMRARGQLTDEQMQEAVGDALSLADEAVVEGYYAPSSAPLHHLTMNRRRAVILTTVADALEERSGSSSEDDPEPAFDDECEWGVFRFCSP